MLKSLKCFVVGHIYEDFCSYNSIVLSHEDEDKFDIGGSGEISFKICKRCNRIKVIYKKYRDID